VIAELAARIRLLVLDVDGVLTDGRLWFGPDGEMLKAFHVRDGVGIKAVLGAGIEVGIISGRQSQVVANRAAELGISRVYQGSMDKLTPYREILTASGLVDEQVAFIGDDLIDIPILSRVGFAAAPADAVGEILPYIHFQTTNRGGWGAVREVCDLLLKEQGAWDSVTARYYSS
jgi:3-deoxy-D-manno-octulosonate 8-phosphate phosphatase (KDO 8-P phosphatase)